MATKNTKTPKDSTEPKPAKKAAPKKDATKTKPAHEAKTKSDVKPESVIKGHFIAVEYTGTLNSGEEFDSSKHNGPITFIVGSGQVIKGFDDAVIGMKLGEEKTFKIGKHDAYGDVNDELMREFPLSMIPEDIKAQLKVGGFLVLQAPTGQQIPTKVVSLDTDKVKIDMNHPLAGQDLTFMIKIVDISDEAPEMDACGCGDSCGCDDGSCGDDCGCDTPEGEDFDDESEEDTQGCGCGHKHH